MAEECYIETLKCLLLTKLFIKMEIMNKRFLISHLRFNVLFCTICLFTIFSSKGENLTNLDFKINVESRSEAIVDSLFTIDYILSYKGRDAVDVEFLFDKNIDGHAKFLAIHKTSQKSNLTSVEGNPIKSTHEDTWSATWKALKPGNFISPRYVIVMSRNGSTDTLDIPSIQKTIKISKTPKSLIKEMQTIIEEAKRIGRSKDNVVAGIEMQDPPSALGDTIRCKLFLLNKKSEPVSNINDISIKKPLSIKNCSSEINWYDEPTFDEVELNGLKYQKIGFAELVIIPKKPGVHEIPGIEFSGNRNIYIYEKNAFWEELPVVVDTYRYKATTTPLKINVK